MIVLAAAGFTALGLVLERRGVAEYFSFALFLAVSAAYYITMSRAWRNRRFLGREIA
jgi:hypothetical protein